MRINKQLIAVLLVTNIMASGITTIHAKADVLETNSTDLPTAKEKLNDKIVITTEDDETYKQIQATSENLQQQIKDLKFSKTASTDITQAKIAGMQVHLNNIKSQMQVVRDKQEAERIRVIEEAKKKADAEKAAQDKLAEDKKKAEEEEAKRIAQTKSTDISTIELSNASELRQKIVAKAKEYLGMQYVWGGASPEIGFDCSGLTSYAYRATAGIETGRTTWDQDAKGKHIGLNELKPGDLILQNSKDHIAMYIGDGMQIESPQPGDVIKIQKVPANPWSMYGLRFID